jgi:manganese-dependent ADP-ribose/CDP-alcohol diphosphatase
MSRLTVGLIADIQYADIPAATSFDGSEKRDYRRSLQHTQVAVDAFLSRGVSHVVNLGDIIDGKSNPNANPTKENQEVHPNSKKALQEVMEVLERKDNYTLVNLHGNHESYCFSFSSSPSSPSYFLPYLPLPPGVHLPDPTLMYYSYSPAPGILFVVLDGYDVCLLRPEGSAEREEAQRLLKAHNPHNPAAWGEGRGDFFQGVVGPEQRWCHFNGALGEGQLAWLRATLEGAREQGGGCKVLVFSHILAFEGAVAARPGIFTHPCLLWNHTEVVALLGTFRDVVKGVFSGHLHTGAFGTDEAGIHHITLPSPLTHEQGSHCILTVYDDRMELDGCGTAMESRVLPFV